MSVPTMLSFDEIHKYMLDHGGKVTNHDLVKHFKKYLTDPSTRDEARNIFKKHVNTLASIKNQNNEKWLILKKKYMPDTQTDLQVSVECKTPEKDDAKESSQEIIPPEPTTEPPPYRPPPVVSPTSQRSNSFKYDETILHEPYVSNISPTDSTATVSEKQNIDYTAEEAVETANENNTTGVSDLNLEDSKPSNNAQESFNESNDNIVQLRRDLPSTVDVEQKISVKERKQMFNRMASEGDVLRPHPANNRKIGQGADDDDRASVVSLDPKGHEWIVAASQGNYHALAKLCTENPKYAKIKDPATTAMHWASKYGNEDLVKLLAGVYRPSVNERSNGGYTPLHIAAQYRNENVCRLLINTYDADPNVRDWSGRKPRQYLVSDDASLSADAFRNFKIKATKKNSDKDLSFLRIGSLNVRVKKTTEAFSNFLGVGPSRAAAYVTKQSGNRNSATIRSANFVDGKSPEHIHKTWGSADNIQNEVKIMPPPQNNKVRRKNMANRRTQDYSTSTHSRSTPTTPNQPRASIAMGSLDINTMLPKINSEKSNSNDDSDSDTVFGFDATWQTKREGTQFT